jgi:hypothetical protein
MCTKSNIALVCACRLQFEAGRAQVGTGGVVRDPKVHQEVIQRITAGVVAWGFRCLGHTESPLKGDKSGQYGLARFLPTSTSPTCWPSPPLSWCSSHRQHRVPGLLRAGSLRARHH